MTVPSPFDTRTRYDADRTMSAPFFTVIIPTCNRSLFLKEAVQSVMDQTFTDFELIVVDDHSTDDTPNVVRSFRDSRLAYLVNDHPKGPGGARNAGLDRAKGRWIAFLDDDDVWLPEKLERVHRKTKEVEDDVGLIYTGFFRYDFENKKVISEYVPSKRGWIRNELLYKNYIGTFSVVTIRSEVLARTERIDEELLYGEDQDFYAGIAASFKIDFIREALTYYRESNTGKLSLNLEGILTSHRLFWEKNKDTINRDFRLRHRAASQVFTVAVAAGDRTEIVSSLPWTFAGLVFDPKNMYWTLRTVFSLTCNEKLKLFLKRILSGRPGT